MFFTATQIAESISSLKHVHPFHGITFLACKKAKLPVGDTINFPLDSKTDLFLRQHHKLNPISKWFFQPFKSSSRSKKWVRHDYSAKGLQAINTQTFRDAFIHHRNTRVWGWSNGYVSQLESRLPGKNRIPAFHLAVWLFRDRRWPKSTSTNEVVEFFLKEFHITHEEKNKLFNVSLDELSFEKIFQDQQPAWPDLSPYIPSPPDGEPEQGGTLAYLETKGIGPADKLVLEPAKRLTLITGDNGLGKTFLLECAWWALTGIWPERPAFPNLVGKNKKAEITFAIEGETIKSEKKTISFDWRKSSWPHPQNRPTIPGLIVYARVDGSFAIWDPAKAANATNEQTKKVFTSSEVWDGLHGKIEGLIRDWVRWQNNPQKYPFETFIRVLKHLSPSDLGQLEPGDSVRIPGDPRDIPTIRHPYGTTPIVYSSAGVRRIITLAYLVVWAWNEHVIAAELARTKPQKRMVVIVDEMEAHLHPRWQRSVLPALISTGEMLSPNLETQFLVATHSPLVMASAETIFDSDVDSLVHLDLAPTGEVSLSEIDFVRYGDVSSWLTSPVFELQHARSREAEVAIEGAKRLQMSKKNSAEEVREVSERLIKYLAQDDKFWPRWISFAEKYGIKL